ncbi:MAG TPA: hypothetical protein VF612_12480 [Jatrophihabitans sp.]|uniref:hypothetical protein n=1 Tax=Jatrophihabitans sp. TaxID=1932789 RepID=UPI002F11E8E1
MAESQVPSLSVIESVLEREDGSYRDRGNSLDTKAGLILSAAGVIVALVGTTASIAAIVGQALAIAAGGAAVWVILPRVDKVIGPKELRDRHLSMDPVRTRLIVLNTRVVLHAKNEARLVTKAIRLRYASALLLGSAVAILMSGILRAAG